MALISSSTLVNDEKSSYKFLIKSNQIEISRLKLRIDEADYNLRESCIDYGSIDDDIVNEDKKVKIYKLEKNRCNSSNK